MPLPDLIEIVPLTEPVHAEITVPGSKSITNRALVLAALADGEVTLKGALWSEDTQVMVECLQELGFMVNVAPDPAETCNRTITVYGQGGNVPRGGTIEQPMELFVGNAGTAARFLAAMVCLGEGVYRLHGVPRMHERPQAALFEALRELGYRIDSPNDKLPALIHGGRSRGDEAQTKMDAETRRRGDAEIRSQRSCTVSIEESSQFASALLLAGREGQWRIEITGENAEESPYVRMTSELIKVFPHHDGEFQIEPDASSGSYFWALKLLVPAQLDNNQSVGQMEVVGWPRSDWQIDSAFPQVISQNSALAFGLNIESLGTFMEQFHGEQKKGWLLIAQDEGERRPTSKISRRHDLGDSVMTAIVVSSFGCNSVQFTDLGRLRVQECERVVALRTELTKCGAKVIEEGDTLTVFPSQLHGAEIETYNDHRMAMCFGVLGLKVPGMKIRNPACVKKTFPNFWQKLAAAPPHGLGATILDARTGRKLSHEELFAD
jgi:3-phosphoshikimate 1-carboxyvinyltransferase